MTKRVRNQEQVVVGFEETYKDAKKKYEVEQVKYDEQDSVKQKLIADMNLLVQQCESDKQRHIDQVAQAYQ